MRTDVYPKKRYIKDKLYTFSSLPQKTHFYDEDYDEDYDGVYYSGTLRLTSYQNTDNGYIALYSGYIYR